MNTARIHQPCSTRPNCIPIAAIALVLLAAMIGMTGCSTTGKNSSSVQIPAKKGEPLLVGITPEYPPLVFAYDGVFMGAEVDMAKALGQELGRPVKFVGLKWDDQIPALLGRRTDIIMSGMSVSPARQIRVAFTEPYLNNELRIIFARKNASRFATPEDVMATDARIGVIPNTTSDVFVQKFCTNASRIPIVTRGSAAFYILKGGRIDAFIDDSFALAQIVSENEADLSFLKPALSSEQIAWAVRPSDPELLKQVNEILARWKTDGTLDRHLDNWMPYLKNLQTK